MSDIRTRPATKEYRDNFDKVFGARRPQKRVERKYVLVTPEQSHGLPNSYSLVKAATSAAIRRRLKG